MGPAEIGGPPITTMLLVGASTQDGIRATFSADDDFLTTYAPGENVYIPDLGPPGHPKYSRASGTSFATPMVAALIAYWRDLPSRWKSQLELPANAKKLVTVMHRPFSVPGREMDYLSRRIIWNGQVFNKNCLIDRPANDKDDLALKCPKLRDDLKDQPEGPPTDRCEIAFRKRQEGAASGCGPGPGPAGPGHSLTFSSTAVRPSPTCTAGGCGSLCTGFYCNPRPTGVPPDYQDPKDPNNDRPRSTTRVSGTTAAPPDTRPPPPPSTPTQPAAPPKPTPSVGRVIIALEETFTPSEMGGSYDREWAVFGVPKEEPYELCRLLHADYVKSTLSSALMVRFPPDLGPFNTLGKRCTYKGSEENLGMLNCEGVSTTSCLEARVQEGCTSFGGVGFNPIVVQVVVCVF